MISYKVLKKLIHEQMYWLTDLPKSYYLNNKNSTRICSESPTIWTFARIQFHRYSCWQSKGGAGDPKDQIPERPQLGRRIEAPN